MIVSATAEELAELRKKLTILQLQLIQWQAITLRKLANEVILDTIHDVMRLMGVSEKIINNTVVSNIEMKNSKTIRIMFHSEYFAESGFDVALAREEGTRDHIVRPKIKLALRWIENGQVRFSKGHKVRGLPALQTIQNATKQLEPVLQERYNAELKQWIEKNLGDKIAI